MSPTRRAASQVSLKSSQRMSAPMLKAGLHGVELIACAGDACAVGNYGAGNNGAKQARAGGILERLKAAA